LEETCRADGKVLLIANSGGTHEARLVKMLASRGVDGIFLVMKDDRTPDPELTSELVDADVPYVMLDRFYDNFECDIVSFDNELGGYLATKHLLDRGHRSIACIINSRDTKNGRDRYRGYMRAMLETNHTLPANCILEGEDTVEHGYSSMKGLLSSGITAVFAGSDEISLGVLKCLHEQNLRVPLDYSVVAYGGGYSDSLFEPPLTVASRDVDGMVHIAYALLEKRRADAKAPCAHEILRPRLVVGGSACPVHERNAFRS
jgi:LacI family transcriptional regulator